MSDLHSWSSQAPVYPPLGLEQQAQKPAAGPLLALLLSGSSRIPPGPTAGVGERGGLRGGFSTLLRLQTLPGVVQSAAQLVAVKREAFRGEDCVNAD